MAASGLYFDTSYLCRLYVRDDGYRKVRELAATVPWLVSAAHAQVEVASALHRQLREGKLTAAQLQIALAQLALDVQQRGVRWLPLEDAAYARALQQFSRLDAGVYLRSADALHLACAAAHGVHTVYSNDRHMLLAAPHFGLKAVNILP
jgi:predicted nucleic acid-binding protein